MLENFVVCNIITTGSDPLKDEIIETGLVRVSDAKIVETVFYYSRPARKLPVRVKNMTGLSDEFLADKPFFNQLLPEILAFIGDASLVSYEADAVYIFFSAAAGHPLPNLCLDALQLAQILLPTLVNYRLINLYEYLFEEDPCVALPREAPLSAKELALLTTRVFLKLCEGFKELEPDLLAKLNIILNKTSENALISFIKVLTAGVVKNYLSGGQGREGNFLKAGGAFFENDTSLFFEHLEETVQMYVFQLNQKQVIDILGPGGELAKQHPHYEHRPQQLEMAVAVAETLNQESLLLTEAGTGTGKSMAYLVPAVLWSVQNQKRVVVSTHTINLQEQLWFKDIPMLKQMLGRTFRAALFKGRQNYLCFSRWTEVLSVADSQNRREALFYSRVLVWLAKTQTGDRSEINLNGAEYDYWSKISADSDSCRGNQCRWFQRFCFVSRAKKIAENSDLIIINHSLLCSDLQAGNRILPSYGPLIIDEAHHLESVATDHFGYLISESTIKHWLNSSEKLAQKLSQIPAVDESSTWDQLIYTVRKAIEDTRQSAKVFFNLLKTERCLADFSEHLPELAQKNVAGNCVKRMYKENDPYEPDRSMEEENLLTSSKILLAGLRKIMMRLEIWAAQYEKWVKIAKTLSLHLNLGTQLFTGIDFILSHKDQNFVYWMEKNSFQNNSYVTLRAVPIDTGQLLYEKLFASPKAVILTSATLAISGSFDYFKERTGLHLYTEKIRQLQIDSPFNYGKQAKLFLTSDLPNQNEVPEQFYHTELANIIEKLVNVSQGKTLVLFTSHHSLKQTYLRLKPVFEEMEILLLGHNIDGSRSALIEEFIRNQKAVLFGTASFWEGIDIPGESLSSVIIVKLPFWSPSIPIIEARLENMVKQGKNSFWEFSLPQAVIRFKQGFGRLIRSSRDHGAVIVLDKRIIQKKYGRYFLNSLPLKHHHRCNIESLLPQINNWLEKKN